jgi:hypothetical protein
MRTIRFLPLAGVAAMLFTAACTEDLRSPVDPDATVPLFAPGLKECDTKDLSSAARDFFPRDDDRKAKVLISELGDACPDLSLTTDLAFDIMALMEMALGGVSELDASAGAALAIGLLPFMKFNIENCEVVSEDPEVRVCVKGGLDEFDQYAEFADDVLLALSSGGAFAVRGPGDLTGAVVSRDAEGTGDQPVWGLTPGLTSTWLGVLGERALLYGHPETIAGECPSTEDCPASDEQYSWNTLPDVDGFGDQMVVGVCAEINNGGFNTRLRMRRNFTALENAGDNFDACVAFLPAPVTASLTERFLRFLSPRPQSLVAFARTGPGGNASDFSDFTPLNAVSEATLVIKMVPDAVVGEPIAIDVTALTVNGTPLEHVEVEIVPMDNNGSWIVDYSLGGTETCPPPDATDATDATDCRYTEEEGGIAEFNLTLDKTGGYRICASVRVRDDGDLGFTFPAEVCSNGFNVRPH